MVSEDVPAQANKILGLNTGAGPRLQLLDVGSWYALIEPESMFWALVAKDKARVRCILNANHTKQDLDEAVAAFKKVGKKLKII
jgi:hypothetical protein